MLPNEYNVEGKTIIITGASRGIGKGIAKVMAESGAKVLVTSLTDRYLVPFFQAMASEGHPIEILTADATRSEDWQRTLEYALSKFGHIDALINNLGDAITKPIIPLPGSSSQTELTDSEWRFILDINLTEAFLGCRTLGPHFIERKKGRIVNISGFAARKGSPNMIAYSAAKAGVARLTQALALEWATHGITVNSIAPGLFPDPETNATEQLAASLDRAKRIVPMGRVGKLREVGLLTLYLVSDASSYMTGETLYIDGGLSHA